MSRLLMVGGGCRGLALARELIEEGHAVRATTRGEARRAQIEAVGAECVIADPDRIGSLRYALDNVTLLLWLLGTARGANVAELHGSRWAMMLEKTIDTSVRGVVYEAAGKAGPGVLAEGRRIGERLAAYNEIPLRAVDADPADPAVWVPAMRAAVESLLAA
ncbi:MAG TPA: hypothetical protein VGJ32_13405 [Solirubrobacteraceae bacterium]